ncbi:MAG: hypothetical protein RIF33_04945 [Cyclobacteriaceae bacterium]
MIKSTFIALISIAFMFTSCETKQERQLDGKLLDAMGTRFRLGHEKASVDLRSQLAADSTILQNWLSLGENEILLFIFGYTARDKTIPVAEACLQEALKLDADHPGTLKLSGMVNFLKWNWEQARQDFRASIDANPTDLSTRHWYSLWLVTMDKIDEALIQHDTIASMDTNEDYLVGRGSIYYFDRDNERLKNLMIRTVEKDVSSPWPYDWLGMAYIELEDYDNSLDTYFKAFELSDGLVEVGAGLGHALGLAGEKALAKEMADYYEEMAKSRYLPQMQRAFIHIGIGEHEEAIALLEEAYEEKSWFLIFMAVEPWLDPLRGDPRFKALQEKMNYPNAD